VAAIVGARSVMRGPVGGPSTGSPVPADGQPVQQSQMEQHGLHAEHLAGQIARTVIPESICRGPESAEGLTDLFGGQSCRCRAAERGDLQQGAPLPADDDRRVTELFTGEQELRGQMRVHDIADRG